MVIEFSSVFFAGMLTFLSPCILPIVPAYLCFISGQSLEELQQTDKANIQKNTFLGVAFVIGLSSVFIALGASATALGQILAEYKPTLSLIGGIVIILFGLHYVGVIKIPFLYYEKRIHLERKPAGFFGAFILGLAFGFGWTPCVGPVLSTVLMVAGGMGDITNGITLLTIYALGLGIPFILAAMLTGPFMRFLGKFKRQTRQIEILLGVFLIFIGILILTGQVTVLTEWMLQTFPALNGLN